MVEVKTMKPIFSQGEKSLEVNRNDEFLILRQGGPDIYIARNSRGLEGEVAVESLGDLRLPDWFQMIDRKAAETKLEKSSPGKFIIRPTTHGKDGEFSVSVKYKKPGDVHHFKLVRDIGKPTWTMWGQNFKSLQDFVKKFQKKEIANKGREQVLLDKNANAEVIVVGDNHNMDTYYDAGDVDEYETYTDAGADYMEESDDIVEGSVVRCTLDFIADEDGTISVSRGDRLMVLYPPTEGWVYVRKENEDEGYVPEENTECERR
eukprot:GFUD01026031.1.p1 GENE.GFUD01026031.1~~GFUD01026031.1.p1  ORF type:complete len:262 (+),score=74.55 GFUD01026031.1:45-830(+)